MVYIGARQQQGKIAQIAQQIRNEIIASGKHTQGATALNQAIRERLNRAVERKELTSGEAQAVEGMLHESGTTPSGAGFKEPREGKGRATDSKITYYVDPDTGKTTYRVGEAKAPEGYQPTTKEGYESPGEVAKQEAKKLRVREIERTYKPHAEMKHKPGGVEMTRAELAEIKQAEQQARIQAVQRKQDWYERANKTWAKIQHETSRRQLTPKEAAAETYQTGWMPVYDQVKVKAGTTEIERAKARDWAERYAATRAKQELAARSAAPGPYTQAYSTRDSFSGVRRELTPKALATLKYKFVTSPSESMRDYMKKRGALKALHAKAEKLFAGGIRAESPIGKVYYSQKLKYKEGGYKRKSLLLSGIEKIEKGFQFVRAVPAGAIKGIRYKPYTAAASAGTAVVFTGVLKGAGVVAAKTGIAGEFGKWFAARSPLTTKIVYHGSKLALPAAYAGFKGYQISKIKGMKAKGEFFGEAISTEIAPFYAGSKIADIGFKAMTTTRMKLASRSKPVVRSELKQVRPRGKRSFVKNLKAEYTHTYTYTPGKKFVGAEPAFKISKGAAAKYSYVAKGSTVAQLSGKSRFQIMQKDWMGRYTVEYPRSQIMIKSYGARAPKVSGQRGVIKQLGRDMKIVQTQVGRKPAGVIKGDVYDIHFRKTGKFLEIKYTTKPSRIFKKGIPGFRYKEITAPKVLKKVRVPVQPNKPIPFKETSRLIQSDTKFLSKVTKLGKSGPKLLNPRQAWKSKRFSLHGMDERFVGLRGVKQQVKATSLARLSQIDTATPQIATSSFRIGQDWKRFKISMKPSTIEYVAQATYKPHRADLKVVGSISDKKLLRVHTKEPVLTTQRKLSGESKFLYTATTGRVNPMGKAFYEMDKRAMLKPSQIRKHVIVEAPKPRIKKPVAPMQKKPFVSIMDVNKMLRHAPSMGISAAPIPATKRETRPEITVKPVIRNLAKPKTDIIPSTITKPESKTVVKPETKTISFTETVTTTRSLIDTKTTTTTTTPTGVPGFGLTIKEPPLPPPPPPAAPPVFWPKQFKPKLPKGFGIMPVKQPKRYAPSATSMLFGIKGMPTKAGIMTGLGIRPVREKRGKKKKLLGLI